MSIPHPESDVTSADIERQLARILGSPSFASSERLKRFLTYVVRETLSGRADEIKEYAIGTQVYDRGDDFDPAHDSIVRTEAARLRKRLDDYYQRAGSLDSLSISLPRGAYVPRFEARSAQSEPAPHPSSPAHPEPDGGDSSSATAETTRRSKQIYVAVCGLLVVASVLPIVALWDASRNEQATARPYVLVGEFANRSGNPRLDGATESVLEFELGQTRQHQPLSRPRVDDVLRLMSRPVDSPLTPEVAREVGLRDGGVHGVVGGSVHRLGDRYVFTARVADPLSARVLATVSVDGTEAEALPTIRRLADEVIRTLEGVQGASAEVEPLEPVTSPSLRAIQLYSAANRAGLRSEWATAESLLKLAVSDDDRFASAQLLLAWSVHNQGRSAADWKPLLEKAVEHASTASQIEQLFIVGSVKALEGEYSQAVAAYEALLRLSPNHYWAVNNLLNDSTRLRGHDAVALARRLVDLRPNSFRTHFMAAASLLRVGDVEEASRFVRRARDLARDSDDAVAVVDLESQGAWLRGDIERSVSLIRAAPALAAVRNGRLYAIRIGLPLAGMGLRRTADAALAGFDPKGDHFARWRGWLAIAAGDEEATDRYAAALVDRYPNALNAILLARTGRVAEAQRLIDRAGETRGVGYDASLFEPIWSVARAEVLLAAGHHDAAEPLFDTARSRLGEAGALLPEFFVAALRQGQLAARRGDPEEARRVLTPAVGQWKRAFGGPLLQWVMCAKQLVLIEEQAPGTGPSPWRPLVERVLASADEDFPILPPRSGQMPRPNR